ncbi:MAG: hypothetical protein LUQ56_04660 [Methylococcaceae bacterium]|nr:hypothetical protein [Methylococcaceae bacterium]
MLKNPEVAIRRMVLKINNTLKLLQISFVYLSLIPLGAFTPKGVSLQWWRPTAVIGAVRRADVERLGIKSLATPLDHVFVIRV